MQFSSGISEILQNPNRILLEIGGGRTLATLAKQHQFNSAETIFLTSLPHPKEEIPDTEFILNSLGKLWLAGKDINWESLHQNQTPYRIPLPTYPFERKRYWVERNYERSQIVSNKSETKSLKQTKKPDIQDWFYVPTWQRNQLLVNNELDIKEKYPCLVFNLGDTFSQRVIAKLQQLDCDVVSVSIGSQFTKENGSSYQINSDNCNDYVSLINDLTENNKIPPKIDYLILRKKILNLIISKV